MKSYFKTLTLLLISVCSSTFADARPDNLGLFASLIAADGEPSNDILGVGLFTTFELQDNWFLDLEYIHSPEADFERPWKVIGLQQSSSIDNIDATYRSNSVMAHIGKKATFSDNADWFWSLGAGFNSIDVKQVSGPLQGGGSFNINTDVDTETLIGIKVGVIHNLSSDWSMHYSFRVEQHLADWRVTDSISNTQGTLDNYMTYGLNIGFSKSF